jgi:tRNA-dihydrouridine synthase C
MPITLIRMESGCKPKPTKKGSDHGQMKAFRVRCAMSFLRREHPAIILAPMEGVTDAPFREFITRTGFYDYCVSEFIRVSSHALPPRAFLRHIPELRNGSKTASGIPVQVQILGGDPDRMALSALAAIEAGAIGIDLNFGCPAPTVNRHDGGATLLKFPHRIEAIVRAVRDAVPAHFPVSAKMRLGFDDPSAIDENVKRAEQGGASWITIHGRTKTQGYIPPAYWKPIGQAARGVSIPVVANGELWTIQDLNRCREETGLKHFMIGRGALAVPGFALMARKELGLSILEMKSPLRIPNQPEPSAWADFFTDYSKVQPSGSRLKQLARYLHTKGSIHWWDQVKTMGSTEEILRFLAQRPL